MALKVRGFSSLEGADINEAAIAKTREAGLVVHDLSCSADFYSCQAGKYDLVVMSHVLEHLPKEQMIQYLVSIRKLLAVRGSLIVMVPNAQANTGCYWAYEDFTHQTLFTAGSLYYVLRAAGFSEVSFIDIDCTAGVSWPKKIIRQILLGMYTLNLTFWNKVTGSAFHRPSPKVFSYEVKAMGRN